MDRQRILETSLRGLRPRGQAGRRVLDSWEQLTGYLRATLGDGPADLLAEPVPGANDSYTWYGPDGARPQAVSALPPEQRSAVLAKVAAYQDAIRAEIAHLRQSGQPEGAALAASLEAALVVPLTARGAGSASDPEALDSILRVVGDQPVLINWGIESEAQAPVAEPLREFVSRPPPPPRPQPAAVPAPAPTVPSMVPAAAALPAVTTPPFWLLPLLWLLFALLMAGIYLALLAGCGMSRSGGLFNFCPAVAQTVEPPSLDHARTEALTAERDRLLAELRSLPRCETQARVDPPDLNPPGPAEVPHEEPPPEDVVEQTPPPQEPPADPEFDQRVEENDGQEGDVTVTLIWDGPSDLDLYVICPNGEEVYYRNMSGCGGALDIDANSSRSSMRDRPVEHAVFQGQPPPGTYKVRVKNYAHRGPGQGPIPYRVQLKKNGEVSVETGAVADGRTDNVLQFSLP